MDWKMRGRNGVVGGERAEWSGGGWEGRMDWEMRGRNGLGNNREEWTGGR